MSKQSFTIPEEPQFDSSAITTEMTTEMMKRITGGDSFYIYHRRDEEMARLSYTVSEQAASDSSDESPTAESSKNTTNSILLEQLRDFNEIHKSLNEITSSAQGTHLEVVVDILKTLAILGDKIKNLITRFQQEISLSTNEQKKTESRLKILICEQYALKIRVIIKELRDNHIFP